MDVKTFVNEFVVSSKDCSMKIDYLYNMFNESGGIVLDRRLFCSRFATFAKQKNIKRSYNGNWQVSVQRITNRGSFFNLEGDEVIMEEYLEKKKSKSFVECNSIEEKKELESKKRKEPESYVECNSIEEEKESESFIEYDFIEENTSSKENSELITNLTTTKLKEVIDCESPVTVVQIATEMICCALTALSFDVNVLKKYKFEIYCLSYKVVKYRGFLELNNVKQYLFLGNHNAIVISLDVPNYKQFFVCAVIAEDPSTLNKASDFANTLTNISTHFQPIKRGNKIHKQEGEMYPYGFHGCRKISNYENYKRKKESLEDSIGWKIFEDHMEIICSHYFTTMKQYFPSLALKYKNMQSEFRSPCVGDSYAPNLFAAFNFASATHVDVFDASYAFGIWYDIGIGTNASNAFVFPQFRIAIQPHHGICALWNSEKALHCTVRSLPHSKTRIGTVIQMNKSLNTKAKKAWLS